MAYCFIYGMCHSAAIHLGAAVYHIEVHKDYEAAGEMYLSLERNIQSAQSLFLEDDRAEYWLELRLPA